MVRAKFIVRSIENEGGTIRLEPVTGGSAENDKFYRFTPSGQISLSTINVEASKQFEVGKQFYVDFTPADE